MSEFLKVTKLSDRAGTGAVNFSNGFNINGSDSGISSFTHTDGVVIGVLSLVKVLQTTKFNILT